MDGGSEGRIKFGPIFIFLTADQLSQLDRERLQDLLRRVEDADTEAVIPRLNGEPLPGTSHQARPGSPQTLREVEAGHISEVLRLTHGQIGEAARILGVHRNTLTRKIRCYGL